MFYSTKMTRENEERQHTEKEKEKRKLKLTYPVHLTGGTNIGI